EDGQRAGRRPARRRVHQDQQVAPVEEVVGQVYAADADVDDLHAGRQRAPGELPDHLDAEPVVAEEDVAHAGDQGPSHGSTSSGPQYRYRPCARCTAAPGSSTRVT